jgi:hypothetical protein
MLLRLWRRATRIGQDVLVHAPLLPLSAGLKVFPRNVVGLCYHVVSDRPTPHTDHLFLGKSAAVFEEHLQFLTRHFEILSYSDFTPARTGHHRRKPGVILTFDDGLRGCIEVAAPLLKKYGAPAVFFITKDFLDNASLHYCHKASLCVAQLEAFDEARLQKAVSDFRTRFGVDLGGLRSRKAVIRWVMNLGDGCDAEMDAACEILDVDWRRFLREERPYLERAEVRAMANDGFTMGAHSVTHRHLGQLDPAVQRTEILESFREIQALTSQPEIPFAFPFSADGVDREMLKKLRAETAGLGLFFDLHGLKIDSDVIVNRIWCESRLLSPTAATPMKQILRTAYQAHCFGL